MKKIYQGAIFLLMIINVVKVTAQCNNPNLLLNLPDTTAIFKQDSVLLDAGPGFATYNWNTGASTRFIWAKNDIKYKVIVTQGSNCGVDSTQVIFIKGIQQKDTTICTGNRIELNTAETGVSRNNIVGWWPFNGNVNDESGNGLNLINYNVTFGNDKSQKVNSSAYFSGSSSYLISNNSYNQFTNNPRQTYAFWFKNVQSNWRYIVNYGNSVKSRIGIVPNTLASTKSIGLEGTNGCTNCGVSGGISTINAPGLNNGWHHIAVSIDSNFYKVYYDGNLAATNSHSGFNCVDTSFRFVFGNDVLCSPEFYNMYLDDIGIWRRALTQSEIQQLYAGSGVGIIPKIRWSTNDTTNKINVIPTTNTTYYCDISVGSFTFKDSVRVNLRPLPNKTVKYAKLGLCENDTLELSAFNGYDYKWVNNDNYIGQNRAIRVSVPGSYVVTLLDSFSCKNISDTIKVFYAPKPLIKVLINDSIQCLRGNNFQFTDSTILDSGTYTLLWDFGNGNFSTITNPSYTYSSVGNYPINLIVSTNFGCKDSLSRKITVTQNPIVGVMLGDSINLQLSMPYLYSIQQLLNHSYNWVATNGIIISGQNTNVATIQWISNGIGKLNVEVINQFGCSDTLSKVVRIGSVGLEKQNGIEDVNLYPNPGNGEFLLTLRTHKNKDAKLVLLNMLGQEIWSKSESLNSGFTSIPVQWSFSPGIYQLLIVTDNDSYLEKLVIK